MELNRIKGKIAFISGASSGIGKAVAEKLAQMGVNLILCARRAEVLAELKTQLEKEHAIEVTTLAFDVRNYQEVAKNIQSLPEKWRQIDMLINNAGLAIGLQHLHTYVFEDIDQMIDTNIKGFTYIANSVIPLMIATGKVGTIVNVGSVAGEIAYPNGSIYCATKFAVRALSDAMRIELMDKNIKVTNVKPGLVETNFSKVRFKGDQQKADNVYKGITPLYKIQITDITVTPLHQSDAIHVHKLAN